MPTECDHSHHIEEFKRLAKSRGLKITRQRLEIFRSLVEAKDHPSAESVFSRIRRRLPSVSLDTVYRTLATFEHLGLALKFQVLGGEARYDGNVSPHYHFACARCRSIMDFEWREFESCALPAQAGGIGRVDSRQVFLVGVCESCLKTPGI